jgi:hypothetical protein
MRASAVFFTGAVLLLSASMQAQPASRRADTASSAWFVSVQPLMVFGLPVGGFRTGMERTLGRRTALAAEFSYRPLNYNTEFLEPGEVDRSIGFQFQPEFRWYLEPSGRKRIPWRSSFSARLGLSYYETDIWNWTFLTDGSGNNYRKILGYVREQRNYDFSLLWNHRIPFEANGQGFGMEIFMGLGIRVKRFEYVDLSPELDEASLRAIDESRMFSLRRDGAYPLLPIGLRIYYRIR